MRIAQNALRVAAAISFALICVSLWSGYHDVYRIHGEVRVGMSVDKVIQLLGEPTRQIRLRTTSDERILIWRRSCGKVVVLTTGGEFSGQNDEVWLKEMVLTPRWLQNPSSLFSSEKDYVYDL